MPQFQSRPDTFMYRYQLERLYDRHGNVDIRAAVILAATLFVGSWVGAYVANQMAGPPLRLLFGLLVCGLGVYLV